MADEQGSPDLLSLTVDVVTAFVANNQLRTEELQKVISETYATLTELGSAAPTEPPTEEFAPAVTARKSLGNREHIISMIDGKAYKSLKRHLSSHGLTPDQYRERYNLSATYPMVAPAYSERRREVAKKLGLGRKPRQSAPAPAAAKPTPSAKPAKRRGRPAAQAKA